MELSEMEFAIAAMFDLRRHIILPNIAQGLGLHECDLLVVRESGYALEVEIKRSEYDMCADLKKEHGHRSEKIKELYYAFPESIIGSCSKHVPPHAGIIECYVWRGKARARITKNAVPNPKSRKLTQEEINKMLRLGVYRIWGMKRKLIKYTKK